MHMSLKVNEFIKHFQNTAYSFCSCTRLLIMDISVRFPAIVSEINILEVCHAPKIKLFIKHASTKREILPD